VSIAYLTDLSRIRITHTVAAGTTASVTVQRSTDEINWTTVRGGQRMPFASGATFTIDDFEFPSGQLSKYRVLRYNSGGTLLGGATTVVESITATLTTLWLKSPTRPFLNVPLSLFDFDDVQQAARNGVFPVVGRSLPIGTTDVRSGSEQTIRVYTRTASERNTLKLVLASGDPVFLHTPADWLVDTRYAVIGDISRRPAAKLTPEHVFTLPLIECAPPHATIAGTTVIWQSVISSFATWSAVTTAEPSWAELMDRIGTPTDVIVP
jgi:hypothetical protein